VLEVADVEARQDELDVGVVADAVCEAQAARLALAALVARAEALVEDAMLDRAAVAWRVQVALVGLELGDGDGLAGREDRELDVLAAGG